MAKLVDRTAININRDTLQKFHNFMQRHDMQGNNADTELNRLMDKFEKLQRERVSK